MNEAAAGAAIGVAKSAGGLSDRELFLLALVILGVVGFWVVKNLTARDERKSEMLVQLFREANEARVEGAKLTASAMVIMERTQATMDVAGRILERVAEYFNREDERREREREGKG